MLNADFHFSYWRTGHMSSHSLCLFVVYILFDMDNCEFVPPFISPYKSLFLFQKVNCVRLLKKFSPETFVPKSHGGGDDDCETEQHIKRVKRARITNQLMELPIEQQIYDMIDAEGSKGLIINEVCHLVVIASWYCFCKICFFFSP